MAYSTIQQVTEETEVETAELQINAKMHQVAFSIFFWARIFQLEQNMFSVKS